MTGTQPGLRTNRWLFAKRRIRPFAGLQIVALLAPAFVSSEVSYMSALESGTSLSLRLRTENPAAAVGDSIRLELGLHNAGTMPIKTPKFFIMPSDDPAKRNLDIEVTDSAGKRLSRTGHVMTGRALYYPEIQVIGAGETYRESIPLAGTFTQKDGGRKRVTVALWSFGENPEVASANEYPPVAPGAYTVRIVYRVSKEHLNKLGEDQRTSIWTGRLVSNPVEITIREHRRH